MATEGLSKSAKQAKEDFAVLSNRLAVAFAKRESLVKSWIASSSRPQPPAKADEELDAEDSALFRNQPPYLGVGAPIPSHFLVSEAEQNNKSLRAKFFPTKGLKASKTRDAEEKAASAKRGLREESSDEEEGRSGLGRAKKLKVTRKLEPMKKVVEKESESEEDSRATFDKVNKSTTTNVGPPRDTNDPHIDLGRHFNFTSSGATGFAIPTPATDGTPEDGGRNPAGELEPQSSIPDGTGRNLAEFRTTDPAELKKLKKREKKRRRKLRAALKDPKG
ncbi:hypothetical protein EG329_007450 [Mollisiaceae sp. DMI_Dod_QoI]|nr:hypothetical protein EG329_007450 [Helotiales sp. DMI_Dod_QoI]